MGFVCMEPANYDVTMAAMICEMVRGDCEFMRYTTKDIPIQKIPSLNPVSFVSRRCNVYETRLHSYLVECFAGKYGLRKYSHCLWDIRNTWAADKYTLMFLINLDVDSGPICLL